MTQLQPLYDKTITCLVCKQCYTTKKIRSRFIKSVTYDTDFFTHYQNEELNPLLYHIHVCPHCGFSASEDYVSYFPPNALEEIKRRVCTLWKNQDYGTQRTTGQSINSYKLAIYCASLKQEKHITMAGLLLRLAWLYRLKQNGQEERHFLKFARDEYIESYSTDDFRGTQMSNARILYMIGELSRRIGDNQQAAVYFSKIIQKHAQSGEHKIVEMARERWYEIREEQKAAI